MEQPPANEGAPPPPAPAQAADSGSSGAAVSSDSEWSDTDESPVASIVDDNDYEMHESCEEVEESDEDLSAFLVDGSVAEQASRLVRDDPCEQKCLKGKEAELGNFLQSVSEMDISERITSVMTALAVLMQADTASFRRGNGVHNKFRYFLPLVDKVCALTFCASYGCTLVTIQHYKAQIRRGEFVQDELQNSPSFVEQLEQTMNDIEDASALPNAKQPKRPTTKKKARMESST
ncbi:unnamed protein product [Phytophthora fragariaefolia]|uniref:Unnamed protein product n=1 Tax=Phytophthora fragariaefolia TaxID=1490495 RepID=A0A9W6WTJ1_9STRA|nr:unnamed protein product [Phytophthora fragariaefolia]